MNTQPETAYRILGVDPGTNILGFGILEVAGKTLKLTDLGVLHLKSEEEQPVKLQRIFERLQEIIAQHQPREMAIETPFYGKNVQSMFKLGRAQGVAIAAAITKGVTVTEYAAKKIKQAVTGNGNASKEQVAAMLEKILHTNLNEQYFDATDALATALCHYYQSTNRIGSGKKGNNWNNFIKDNPGRVKK
ncbi:MAG: crossover junction endodeoxyribonuclease RuvC [Saprospiraceae bacterium]